MKLPASVYDDSFDSFDPYSIFDRDSVDLKKLGLDFTLHTLQKPIVSIVTQNDMVFGLNDMAVAGLVKLWKHNTRQRNRKLLLDLIKYHAHATTIEEVERDIFTLMTFAALPIGKTALAWYSQLNNPIRANVIKSFVKNVPKSIMEGSDYFENVGKDLMTEREITCRYYFNELNKTILAYLVLVFHYRRMDPKYVEHYVKKMEMRGYRWFACPKPTTDDIYAHAFKYRLFSFGNQCCPRTQSLSDLYRSFDNWAPYFVYQLREHYDEHRDYVKMHGTDYLEAFRELEERDKQKA